MHEVLNLRPASKILNPLVLILILAVIVRFGALFIIGPSDPDGGFLYFDRMAKNLLQYGDFHGEPFVTYGSPNISPGFAFWLAFLYLLFGSSVDVFFIAQVILGVLVVWGTYLLACTVFSRRVGLTAALIAALFPPLVVITTQYSNTLLYSVLFLFSVYFWWLAVREKRYKYAVAAGGLLGLAALNEAVVFYLPVALGLWLAGLVMRKKLTWKPAVGLVLTLILAFSIVLAPWAYHNVKVADVYNDKVRILSKGEFGLVSPERLKFAGQNLIASDVFLNGLKKMFAFPYGLLLLDDNPAIAYKELPQRVLKGEQYPPRILLVFAIKTLSAAVYWILLLTSLIAAFKFRLFGSLTILLLVYVIVAVLGFTASRGAGFEDISHPGVFVVPLWPLLAVLASRLFAFTKIS